MTAPTNPTPAAYDVVGIGNAIVDVLVQVEDAFLDEHGLTKGSMALVDAERSDALYAAMGPAVEVSGGSAANTIVGLAGFGATTAYIGRIRDDQLGAVFAHDIRAAGVTYDFPAASSGPGTARCLVLVTADAERTLNTYLGASVELGPAEVDLDLAASGQVLYAEGYLWDAPDAIAALTAAMDAARAAGRKVAFTLSDGFCVDRHRAEFRELLATRVDIAFANHDEICSLFEVDDFDQALKDVQGLLQAPDASLELACITRSELGSVLVTATEVVAVAAHATELVDTTGAGDLYAAGVLYGLTHGLTLEQSGQLGSLGAAEVISHIGARPQVPLAELAQRELGLTG